MKNKTKNQKPTKSKFTILRQICNWIPNQLVPKLARETQVEEEARTYKPWSHVVALLYAQLTHSLGLNDVCDALGLHSLASHSVGKTGITRVFPRKIERGRETDVKDFRTFVVTFWPSAVP